MAMGTLPTHVHAPLQGPPHKIPGLTSDGRVRGECLHPQTCRKLRVLYKLTLEKHRVLQAKYKAACNV